MIRLKELRGSLTQDQTAKKLGLNRQTYRNYESGVRQPDFETLINIANYYNVSIDYLLGRTESARDPLSGWTEEEKAAGVGRHSTYLSEDEMNWLELRSEILRLYGEKHLSAVVTMLETWINKKD